MHHLRTPTLTCDFYILPNVPPAAPDITSNGFLRTWWEAGMQVGKGKTKFMFDSALDVLLADEEQDPWPNQPTGLPVAGQYRIYIPTKMDQGFDVIFIERFRLPPWYGGHGGQDFKRVFLRRRAWNPKQGLFGEGGLKLGRTGNLTTLIGLTGKGGLTLAGTAAHAGHGSQSFTSPGTGSFTMPANINNGTALTITVYGAGSDAGQATPPNQAAGGGGAGAAAQSTVVVNPGTVVFYSIGNRGNGGGDTWANAVANNAPASSAQGALAKGGGAGLANGTGGGGGNSAQCIGTVVAAGGNGGNGPSAPNNGGGGGGGSGLVTHGNGGNGTPGGGGAGGIGDTGTGGAGATGAGQPNGMPGTGPGAAGGGCWSGGGTTGLGVAGEVKLSW